MQQAEERNVCMPLLVFAKKIVSEFGDSFFFCKNGCF